MECRRKGGLLIVRETKLMSKGDWIDAVSMEDLYKPRTIHIYLRFLLSSATWWELGRDQIRWQSFLTNVFLIQYSALNCLASEFYFKCTDTRLTSAWKPLESVCIACEERFAFIYKPVSALVWLTAVLSGLVWNMKKLQSLMLPNRVCVCMKFLSKKRCPNYIPNPSKLNLGEIIDW